MELPSVPPKGSTSRWAATPASSAARSIKSRTAGVAIMLLSMNLTAGALTQLDGGQLDLGRIAPGGHIQRHPHIGAPRCKRRSLRRGSPLPPGC